MNGDKLSSKWLKDSSGVANLKHSEVLRAQIVTYAEEYLDAPYKWNSVQPYKGSHCAEYALTPYRRAKLIEAHIKTPIFHKDWLMGKKVDPNAFRDFILQFAERVEYDDRQTADLITFEWMEIESHASILARQNPDYILHSPSGESVKFQRLQKIPSLVGVYRHKEILRLERDGR